MHLLRGGQPNSSGLLLPWGQEPYVPELAREEAGCPGCGTCGALPGGDCGARDAGTTNEPHGDGSATGSATAITLLDSGGARGLGTGHLRWLVALARQVLKRDPMEMEAWHDVAPLEAESDRHNRG